MSCASRLSKALTGLSRSINRQQCTTDSRPVLSKREKSRTAVPAIRNALNLAEIQTNADVHGWKRRDIVQL